MYTFAIKHRKCLYVRFLRRIFFFSFLFFFAVDGEGWGVVFLGVWGVGVVVVGESGFSSKTS